MVKERHSEIAASPAVESTTVRPQSGGSPLRWLLPLMLVLGVVTTVVWGTRPKAVEVYNPPPPSQKTVQSVQEQMDLVKNNPHIPKNDKGRILGLLQGDLEKAKVAQASGK